MVTATKRDKRDGIILFATLAILVLLSSLLITTQNIVINQASVVQRIFQRQDTKYDVQSARALAVPNLMDQIANFNNGELDALAPIFVNYRGTTFRVEATESRYRKRFAVSVLKD